MKLKKNVEVFNDDVISHHGYRYTTNASYSSIAANRRLTDITVQKIPSNIHSLVDIGCGDGLYTSEIKKSRPELAISGTDAAVNAVEIARKRYPEIDFFPSNIIDMGTVRNRGFDMAVIRGALHHLSESELAIKNTAKIASIMLIIEPNGNNPLLKILEKVSRYHREHEERSFSSLTLKGWCTKYGWKIKSVDYVGFVPFFFPTTPARIIHFFQPLLEKIPLVRNVFSAQIVLLCERKS